MCNVRLVQKALKSCENRNTKKQRDTLAKNMSVTKISLKQIKAIPRGVWGYKNSTTERQTEKQKHALHKAKIRTKNSKIISSVIYVML